MKAPRWQGHIPSVIITSHYNKNWDIIFEDILKIHNADSQQVKIEDHFEMCQNSN